MWFIIVYMWDLRYGRVIGVLGFVYLIILGFVFDDSRLIKVCV